MIPTFTRRHLTLLTLGLTLTGSLTACFDKDDDPKPDDAAVSESLHFAFKTPDWERQIDCEKLNLAFRDIYSNPRVAYASASSASTNSTFFLTYSADSSALVAPANLGKYAITEYGASTSPFELSHKLPPTEGSASRLVSVAGLSATSYNEILAVKYVGHEKGYALFDVKGRYQMLMQELNSPAAPKPVSGTFKFRLRTTTK